MKTQALDDIKLMQRRFELITVSRYRNKDRIKRASQRIDKIREKTKGGRLTTEVLRDWRDKRYGPPSD